MTNKQDLTSKMQRLKQSIKDCQFAIIKLGAEYPLATRALSAQMNLDKQKLAESRADYERMGY